MIGSPTSSWTRWSPTPPACAASSPPGRCSRPVDIERLTGATGGHWHHGELAVDQMLMLRPVNGMGHYATGVPGLFLCGAAAHPGGDVMGVAGRNAALAAMNGGGHA